MITLRSTLYAVTAGISLLSMNAFGQNAVIVNGKSIPASQLDKMIQQSGQPDNPQIRNQAREMLVTRELIIQEADKRGLTQSDSIREKLEQARMGILVSAVFEDYIQKEGITEDELKAAYETMKSQYTGKEYHVEHILVEKEADAKAITAQLKAGASFEDLARSKSKDPGSAPNGGDLGWVGEKSLVPEFSKAMVQLKKGQTTDKPIKTQFGWHVIKVEDIRDVKTPTLDEMRNQLKQMIASDQNWQKAKFTEMLQKFRAKAKIQ